MNVTFEDFKKNVETYYMLHIDSNKNISSREIKAFREEDVKWFFQNLKILLLTEEIKSNNNKKEIINMLKSAIYKREGQDKASISTIKDIINKISNKHIYCKIETSKSRLA